MESLQRNSSSRASRLVVEEHDFCESKGQTQQEAPASDDGFMKVPEGIENDLPFR